MRSTRAMQSLGIYLSVPFCRSKCSFCNFASGVYPEAFHERYVERLCEDIHAIRGQMPFVPRMAGSVYLGGGTPGILSPALLRRIFTALREEFDLEAGAEITLECAPGQTEDATLEAMAACGVNRVSFGVQSFVDREAALSGRLHTRAAALRDLERVRAAGIRRVSVDLIAGLPEQTAASWRESLGVLAGAAVEHASIYLLEVDEDSRLGREMLAGGVRYHAKDAPSGEQTAEFYEQAAAFLEARGCRRYEISNFAQPGVESAHNCKYWRREPYLGFGLDAHSMLRDPDGRALRFAAEDGLNGYLAGAMPAEPRVLSRCEEIDEAWFLGLRMSEGISLRALAREFGAERIAPFEPVLRELREEGWIEAAEERIRLTRPGILLSNEIFARFLDVARDEPAGAVA